MISKEFVPYELCIALREIGFDEKCLGIRVEDYDWNIELSYEAIVNSKLDKRTKELEEEREEGDEPIKDVVSAVLYSQAFRWFRKNYNLYHAISGDLSPDITDYPDFEYAVYSRETGSVIDIGLSFTYDDAEETCLEKLIEVVRNEKQK